MSKNPFFKKRRLEKCREEAELEAYYTKHYSNQEIQRKYTWPVPFGTTADEVRKQAQVRCEKFYGDFFFDFTITIVDATVTCTSWSKNRPRTVFW